MTGLTVAFFTHLCVFSAGLAQYSGDPKTEWHLNAHPTKESLLNAIANLPYKGGNTMTGECGIQIHLVTLLRCISQRNPNRP